MELQVTHEVTFLAECQFAIDARNSAQIRIWSWPHDTRRPARAWVGIELREIVARFLMAAAGVQTKSDECRAYETDPTERYCLWISAGLILCSLLALVFVALVYDVKTTSPLFVVFVFMLEIVAGMCAGILAGTIVGFFKVELEAYVGPKSRMLIQATGGFAVFLVVMSMSPRDQMSRIADTIFHAQLADCRNATSSAEPGADAEGLCQAVISSYPNRPEPLALLGRYTHRNSSLHPNNLIKARDYLQRAWNLYGIPLDATVESLSEDYSNYQLSVLRDVVYGAAVTVADADLRAYGLGYGSEQAVLQSLDKSLAFLQLAERLGRSGGGNSFRIRVGAVMGVVQIYSAYLGDTLDRAVLGHTQRRFEDTIAIDPENGQFQHYNVFVVATHRGYQFDDEAALVTAKMALQELLRHYPICWKIAVMPAMKEESGSGWLK